MWKNWTVGILGMLIIVLPFAGLSFYLERVVFAALGIIMALLAFWAASEGSGNARQ